MRSRARRIKSRVVRSARTRVLTCTATTNSTTALVDCWVVAGGSPIHLVGGNVVPRGRHLIEWLLRGSPGNTVTLAIDSDVPRTIGPYTIAQGNQIDSGPHQPSGYAPVYVDV